MKSRLTKVLLVGLVVTIFGCGEPTRPAMPTLNLTSGQIAFADPKTNVESADHAVVIFHPKNGAEEGKISGAVMEGGFSMVTEKDGEKILGAPEGDYLVSIKPNPRKKNSIPTKYQDPKTSGLTATVTDGNNTIETFVLTK